MQLAALCCAAASLPCIATAQDAQAPRSLDLRAATCPQPEYPRAAIRADAEGRTVVMLTVSASGEVSDVRVVEKSGDTTMHALLDAEAVRVTASCRFPEAVGTAPTQARLPYLWKIE
jgi:periplasmic protein TonB